MKLTEENQKIILEWINNKCGQMRCTCCGNGIWTVVEISTLQIGFNVDTTRFHYHEGMPLASIGCQTCGHIVQFSTAMMGIRPKEVPVEKTT